MNQQANSPARDLSKVQPSRMPLPTSLASEYDLTPGKWRVLIEQLYPSAKSPESVLMALDYCRTRGLDIFKRPVHIVPMYSTEKKAMVETVWPGISEIRTTASRTKAYAGIEETVFGPMVTRDFKGEVKRDNKWKVITETVTYPEWASVVVHRIVKGGRGLFHAKIYWEETYATQGKGDLPNQMWMRRPRGQLDKCVEAAALRKAFPEELGDVYAAEEMEGQTIVHNQVEAHEETPEIPAIPSPDPIEQPAPKTEEPPAPPSPEEDDDVPGLDDDIEDANVVEETAKPDTVDHQTVLSDAMQSFEIAQTPGEVEEVKSESESLLDGAPDDIFAKFNGYYADALARTGGGF